MDFGSLRSFNIKKPRLVPVIRNQNIKNTEIPVVSETKKRYCGKSLVERCFRRREKQNSRKLYSGLNVDYMLPITNKLQITQPVSCKTLRLRYQTDFAI